MLTGSFDYQQARKYWKVLKGRLIKEGNETVTNSYQLKLPAAAGKQRLTDMAKIGLLTPLKDVASFIKHTPMLQLAQRRCSNWRIIIYHHF